MLQYSRIAKVADEVQKRREYDSLEDIGDRNYPEGLVTGMQPVLLHERAILLKPTSEMGSSEINLLPG